MRISFAWRAEAAAALPALVRPRVRVLLLRVADGGEIVVGHDGDGQTEEYLT